MSGTPARRSPSPSEVGFSLFSRRQLLAVSAAVAGGSALLAACGSDEEDSEGTSAPAGTTASAGTEPAGTTAPAAAGGEVTFGSNYSDPKDSAAIAAAIDTVGLDVKINTVDHNTYQENFNTYVQQPDDVMCWFAGYRMRAFARKGVVGDVTDVWANLGDMSDGFKNASTLDGKQYFVPFYFYPWAIHYRKSLFEEKGYEIPGTWDDLLALCDKMVAGGITPFAGANDGGWPQMGMFDMINMRTNGYDFHVSLMGGNEDWTGDAVKQVFTNWAQILDYMQPDANGRTWQDAATAFGNKEVGMYLLGTFITSNFDPTTDDTAQEIIDDIDFFAFPVINEEFGQDAVEAPIDGFMLAAEPKNADGAKALLSGLGQATAIDAYIAVNPAVVAANGKANTSGYNALQKKSAELVGSAKYISQFLDRDTDPDFAAKVVGAAIADFIADPSSIDSILSSVEEQKATYTFE